MVVPVASAGRPEPGLPVKVLGAGTAACVADGITFPLDVAKVRLQIQGESARGGPQQQKARFKYRGIVGTLTTMVRQEGPASLYNGLCAGLQRQMCFASVRIGLYDSVKNYYGDRLARLTGSKEKKSGVGIRILAGISTGGLSVVCAQPTDVVKVRMQAQGGGRPKRYSGTLHAYKTIGRQEGLAGLWKVFRERKEDRRRHGLLACRGKVAAKKKTNPKPPPAGRRRRRPEVNSRGEITPAVGAGLEGTDRRAEGPPTSTLASIRPLCGSGHLRFFSLGLTPALVPTTPLCLSSEPENVFCQSSIKIHFRWFFSLLGSPAPAFGASRHFSGRPARRPERVKRAWTERLTSHESRRRRT